MSTSPPLRILAIHGFCQSAVTFRGRTAAIKNKLKKLAVFDYAEAPHELQSGDHIFVDEALTTGPKYSWWRVDPSGEYNGLVDSIHSIRSLFLSSGPYHGLFGFSQGGAFLALLLQLHTLHVTAVTQGTTMTSLLPPSLLSSPSVAPLLSLEYGWLDSVRFALLFAAFIPRAPGLRGVLLDGRWKIPQVTLHVMGTADKNIDVTASQELMGCFTQATAFVHSGGHHVPSDKDSRPHYIAFIEAQRQRVEEEERKTPADPPVAVI